MIGVGFDWEFVHAEIMGAVSGPPQGRAGRAGPLRIFTIKISLSCFGHVAESQFRFSRGLSDDAPLPYPVVRACGRWPDADTRRGLRFRRQGHRPRAEADGRKGPPALADLRPRPDFRS